MARFHVQETVYDTEDAPLDGATVSVCVLGTTELSREPLYADDSSATLLANPLTSDGSGVVEFYLANPLACDLVPVKDGVAGQTVTVRPGRPAVGDVPTWDGRQDVHQTPSGGGSGLPRIAFSGSLTLSDTAAHVIALTVGEDITAYRVGEWTNNEDGDLVLPVAGSYRATFLVTQPVAAVESDLELRVNSETSEAQIVGGHVVAPAGTGTVGVAAKTTIVSDVNQQGTAGVSIGGLQLRQFQAAAAAAELLSAATVIIEYLALD